jgi:hypothetical protein
LAELLDLLMGLEIDGIKLRPCVVHQLSTFIDCTRHRAVKLCLVLNLLRVPDVHDVHRVDHFSGILNEKLISDTANPISLVVGLTRLLTQCSSDVGP